MKVTIGGDRLGSGNKNKIALRNYERSTHDLSRKFTSSMQCGTLYPFLVIPAMRGDKFTINLDADARTIPTKGPLFGSFKMQLDLFQCDIRLYQAILHNNPLAIGMNMKDVKFPTLGILDASVPEAFSNSCLLKYLGMSGVGHNIAPQGKTSTKRVINAIPALAYYEIFKTYYSNKQEENAYIIGDEEINVDLEGGHWSIYIAETDEMLEYGENTSFLIKNTADIYLYNANDELLQGDYEDNIIIFFRNELNVTVYADTLRNALAGKNEYAFISKVSNGHYKINQPTFVPDVNTIEIAYKNSNYTYKQRGLQPFPLENIDKMRLALLSHHELGTPYKISEWDGDWTSDSGKPGSDGLPYTNLTRTVNAEKAYERFSLNHNPLNGLCVKTYQSDLFNNWVNTEWIDGENGISEITAISTASGSITIDSLNLSEKLYNMLNRIAVSDGSYEGWQDAVYTETPKRHIESPIYLGGMSSEIVFEEIVQTAPAEGSALGTLGGKGKLLKRKGGHVTVKCNEACFIIGIVSLTPRINYTQGNEFYLTDLMSMDDFHKPALDGIGFQDLIAERMAWWDTAVDESGGIGNRHSIGKLPAWIEYMTAVDKSYGDFAETKGRGFMSLNREYDREGWEIKDATTYIDPRKYNYAFAYTDIDAQNFWVQIYSDIKARRLMSAKQIPNI